MRNSRGFGGTELLILTVFLGLVVVILHFRHENEECKQKELRATAELAPIAEEVGSWYRTKGELPGDAFMLRWILHWGIADYPGRPDNPFGGFMTIYDVGPGGATSDHNADQILPGNAGYYVVETGDTGYVCIFGKNAGVIADTTIVIPG